MPIGSGPSCHTTEGKKLAFKARQTERQKKYVLQRLNNIKSWLRRDWKRFIFLESFWPQRRREKKWSQEALKCVFQRNVDGSLSRCLRWDNLRRSCRPAASKAGDGLEASKARRGDKMKDLDLGRHQSDEWRTKTCCVFCGGGSSSSCWRAEVAEHAADIIPDEMQTGSVFSWSLLPQCRNTF